ncbi:DNA polymerase alpha subunit B-like isoform X2 [Monodelphis domestica]|uniref:DNA polymerase alpha subunit B-like isoform X2 n=1 Tax=Monodelphis domestica TaxID=13616 RepID=UPI0024E20040|nr:DNA polymerase alpha subunit B-like isoform X2 [Monodelphis domestica]
MGPKDRNTTSAERLAGELQIFGLDCEPAAYEKLAELCPLYWESEDELVAALVAFSTNTGKVFLTLENLNSFENEFLTKRISRSRQGATKKDSGLPGTWDIVSIQELIEVEAKEETLLNSYATPSKGSQKRSVSTPETPQSKRNVSAVARSPRLLFSPSSFSPSATPSQKYSSRSSRGEVVTSFGSTQGKSWSGRGGGGRLAVKVLDAARSLSGSYKSMFQKLTDVREVLTCKIEELGYELKELHQIEAFSPILVPAQEPVTVLGQIGCDSNGKLNPKSVILEGDREHSLGVQIPVDLSELKEYSLFPGQVVVMDGTNSTGKRFIATKLYEGAPLPFYQPTEEDGDSDQRMVLVACGPYTTSDSITYDPMMDLIGVISRDQPDVCILLGPFLDAKHEQVENCQLTISFEEVFKKCLWSIIEGTRSSGTHLVFVPSLRDVHHQPVYPQPPFSYPELPKEDKQRVHFVSDPCTLSVNGVVLGLTSTDLLFHMGAEEISSSSSTSDRFSRILKHILTQRSYYPLYPPFEEMSIDFEHFYSYAQLPVTPDVFIVPSELRYFVKDILGCVCVNPGRLTKGQVGGTFGRLYISRQPAGGNTRKSPCTAAQVVRI